MDEKLGSIIALVIGIFFAFIISEVVMQIIDFPSRPISGWLNCKSKNAEECNDIGFRGRKIAYSDDDFIVILLGDSEVYAPGLPFEYMPERMVENSLKKYNKKIKVFTVGDMGYGQDQQYLALKKYFEEYRANLVLLMFTARNDIENNIFPVSGRNKTIKPTFWLENGELHGPSERWLEPIGSRIKMLLLVQSHIGKTLGELRLEQWKKTILPTPYQPLSNYEGEADFTWHNMFQANPQSAFMGLDYEMVGFGNQLKPRSELRAYGIQLTRNLFSKIKEITESNNGRFVIFKEERKWEIGEPLEEKVMYLKDKYYIVSMRQYQNNLRELFDGFEHYRISLTMDSYNLGPEDNHLSHQAINMYAREISEIMSIKKYLQ